jgi:hypothetical protein
VTVVCRLGDGPLRFNALWRADDGISDRLTERGYITRTEDPNNRRYRVLALTPTGRETREAALNGLDKACPLSRLSDGDRDDLLTMIGRTLTDDDGVTAWRPRSWGST